MYEYRTQTFHGPNLPEQMSPPAGGFRFRDAKYVETNSNVSHAISYGGMQSSPYAQSSSASSFGHWVVIWERYAPEQENE